MDKVYVIAYDFRSYQNYLQDVQGTTEHYQYVIDGEFFRGRSPGLVVDTLKRDTRVRWDYQDILEQWERARIRWGDSNNTLDDGEEITYGQIE